MYKTACELYEICGYWWLSKSASLSASSTVGKCIAVPLCFGRRIS